MLVNKVNKGFNFYKYNFKSENVGGGTSSLVPQGHGRGGLSSLGGGF